MTSVSSANSPTLSAPSSSLPSSRRGSETHRILNAFAIGRPEPYGKIPLRRPSGPHTSLLAQSSISPPDVNLSGIEGFDYDESWSLGIHPFLAPSQKRNERAKAIETGSSVSSPTEITDDERKSRKDKTLSRSSTISSRRSSKESGRRPSLLQQSISSPITTSQPVSATGQASTSPRTSKSLAEKGGLSTIPSLYRVSRGRSAKVKLGGNWIERRGTSASVLLPDEETLVRSIISDGKRREKKDSEDGVIVGTRSRRRRKSSEATESALFSSEDELSLTSDEEIEEGDAVSCATSRRSSIERDRRRGLKILLTPSVIRQSTSDDVAVGSSSLTTSTSDEALSQDDRAGSLSPTEATILTKEDVEKSSLLERRRSSSGKRLLGTSLRSNSSSHRPSTRLEVIFAGLTPDGSYDNSQLKAPFKSTQPVDVDADPLLSSAIGSVSDLIDVDAVEWNDSNRRTSSSLRTEDALKKNKRQTVAEQEKERRMGFAAAYQNRLASLLWSTKASSSKDKPEDETVPSTDSEAAPVPPNADSDSLLTSSWKRLIQLPNLLLMPTLGPSRTSALQAEELKQEGKRVEGASGTDEASAAQLLSMPPSPGPTMILPPSPVLSPNSSKEMKGRGVMNPLEGDADVSAYVSGLGLPIDPDLELSSVVHLQTFRTSHTPFVGSNPSRSRRGSLEKPISGDSQLHRRAYSDNKMEPPSPSLRLGKKLSDELQKGSQRLEDAKEEAAAEKRKSRSSVRACSRPAVQAPVPGGFSAYNSSESEDDSQKSSSDDNESRQSKSKRGRTSGGRRRSCSPPIHSRKQCAIGLFESRAHSRSRTSEVDLVEDDASAQMIRVRSTPNLPSLTAANRKRQERSSRRTGAGGRGRAGSIKVVSASIAGEEEGIQGEVKAITALPNMIPIAPPIALYPSPPLSNGSKSSSPLGLGLPGNQGEMTVRPSMVSNGAHLLMLSLELEMMRHRKITCSLKPRWLKARVRSDSGLHRLGGQTAHSDSNNRFNPRISSHADVKPKMGSSLRFEIV